MSPFKIIVLSILMVLVVIITWVTLSMRTKSEGLGAAITGASDTHRGAVGVEQQKKNMVKISGWAFIILSLIFALLDRYMIDF